MPPAVTCVIVALLANQAVGIDLFVKAVIMMLTRSRLFPVKIGDYSSLKVYFNKKFLVK